MVMQEPGLVHPRRFYSKLAPRAVLDNFAQEVECVQIQGSISLRVQRMSVCTATG